MDRVEKEKEIVAGLSAKLQNNGFCLLKEKYKGEHYAEFAKKDGDATLIFSVILIIFNVILIIEHFQCFKSIPVIISLTILSRHTPAFTTGNMHMLQIFTRRKECSHV